MNKWFISDTHFSHNNIIRYTGRPFQSVNEMDERLIENWNAHIAPQDIVFFLGDFGKGTTELLATLCARLHGNKICIRGNHDGTHCQTPSGLSDRFLIRFLEHCETYLSR